MQACTFPKVIITMSRLIFYHIMLIYLVIIHGLFCYDINMANKYMNIGVFVQHMQFLLGRILIGVIHSVRKISVVMLTTGTHSGVSASKEKMVTSLSGHVRVGDGATSQAHRINLQSWLYMVMSWCIMMTLSIVIIFPSSRVLNRRHRSSVCSRLFW